VREDQRLPLPRRTGDRAASSLASARSVPGASLDMPLPAPVTTTSWFPNGFCASLMGLSVFYRAVS